jgi:hypothetical protein
MTTPVKDHRPRQIQGIKYGVARCRVDFDDLTAAATSEVITFAEAIVNHPTGAEAVPTNARVMFAWINLLEEFAGGSVSAITMDLGDAGNDDELVAAEDVFTGASTGVKTGAGAYTLGTFEAAYTPILTFEATDDNVVNLTAGAVEVCIAYQAVDSDSIVKS